MSDVHKRNLAVPFFTQRDNTYVWQQVDSDSNLKKGPKYPMAWRSCNITSLCMILHYFGITDDSPDDMLYKIFDSEEYKNDGKFSQWRTSDYPAEDAISQLEMAVDLIKDVVKELKKTGENIGYNR